MRYIKEFQVSSKTISVETILTLVVWEDVKMEDIEALAQGKLTGECLRAARQWRRWVISIEAKDYSWRQREIRSRRHVNLARCYLALRNIGWVVRDFNTGAEIVPKDLRRSRLIINNGRRRGV